MLQVVRVHHEPVEGQAISLLSSHVDEADY
jgi:hypothetical protein